MPSYSGTADTPSKAKAIVGVVAVHALLAAAILTGLNVRVVSQVVERLQTIDIRIAPPPPEPPPPPAREPKKVELEEGAAGKKADPSPIVAPKPHIPVQSPLPAAPVAGTGSATTAGAATAGTGTGAGGSGAGRGAGGDTSGFTPARLVRNLSRGDYWRLTGGRLASGSAIVSLRVEADGTTSNCRLVRSSGDAVIDSGLCPLITTRLSFRPALDDHKRPIPYRLQYIATWRL